MKKGLVLVGVIGAVSLLTLAFQRKAGPATVTQIEVKANGKPQVDWHYFLVRVNFGRCNPESKSVDWGYGGGWQQHKLWVAEGAWQTPWTLNVYDAVNVTHVMLEATRLTTAGPVVVKIKNEEGRVVASTRFENAEWSYIATRTLELR